MKRVGCERENRWMIDDCRDEWYVLCPSSTPPADATHPKLLCEAIQVLTAFLEYPHNQHREEAQELLSTLLCSQEGMQ